METIEDRVAWLESQLRERHIFYTLLLHLIFRQDDRLRLDVAEAIRKILQNPIKSHPLPPSVQQQLRQLRDDLLAPPLPGIEQALSQPPVRLVDG